MKKKLTRKKTNIQQLTHDEMPASVGLVKEIRDELRAEIRSVRHDVESVKHDLESVRHDVESVRHDLSSKIEQVTIAVHRTQVLMEEQRSENKIVLDGLKSVLDRQNRFETDLVNLRDTAGTLKTIV